MNRDEIRGKAEKGIKEEAGELMNDPELEAEGRAERATGKLRGQFGKAKRKVGEAVIAAASAALSSGSSRPDSSAARAGSAPPADTCTSRAATGRSR